MSLQDHFLRSLTSEGDMRVRANNFARVLEAGVSPDYFQNDDHRRAFEFINSFYLQYGTVPSLAVVRAELEIHSLNDIPPENPFEYYFTSMLRDYRKSALATLIQEAANKNLHGDEEGRDAALIRAITTSAEQMSGPLKAFRLSSLGQNAVAEHMRIQRGDVAPGVKIGIPYIDEQTGGAQPGDLWVFAGSSGSGKTFLTCRCCMGAVMGRFPGPRAGAVEAWARRKVLYISMEMSNTQIGMRDLSLGAQISGTRLRLGQLTQQGVEKARDFLSGWVEDGHDGNLLLFEGGLHMTADNIAALVKQHRPDAVFVDGAYLVGLGSSSSKKRWEVNMEVLESLKRLALGERIPIIATFQFDQKVKTKGIANIMGGQSIGQIASIVIGIGDYEAEVKGQAGHVMNKSLTILKGRSGESGSVGVTYDMNQAKIEEIPNQTESHSSIEEFDGDLSQVDEDEGMSANQDSTGPNLVDLL
jgi:replicative DNA helicase